MAKYLPDILAGDGGHDRARAPDRRQPALLGPGWCWRCCAALGIRPLNWLIIFIGRPVPLAAAAGDHRADAISGCPPPGWSPSGFVVDVAVACPGADGLLRGDLLGGHHLGPARANGRPRARPASASWSDFVQRGPAAGLPAHHPAAHQPHHRHHQGHGAGHRRRRHRDPGAWRVRRCRTPTIRRR